MLEGGELYRSIHVKNRGRQPSSPHFRRPICIRDVCIRDISVLEIDVCSRDRCLYYRDVGIRDVSIRGSAGIREMSVSERRLY